jgi:hypothetical protein
MIHMIFWQDFTVCSWWKMLVSFKFKIINGECGGNKLESWTGSDSSDVFVVLSSLSEI